MIELAERLGVPPDEALSTLAAVAALLAICAVGYFAVDRWLTKHDRI